MEKVTVESIDKKSGMALLSNRVKVARTLGPDNTYPRLDGKEGKVLPLTEENEKVFLAFKAYFSIKRNMEFWIKKFGISGMMQRLWTLWLNLIRSLPRLLTNTSKNNDYNISDNLLGMFAIHGIFVRVCLDYLPYTRKMHSLVLFISVWIVLPLFPIYLLIRYIKYKLLWDTFWQRW